MKKSRKVTVLALCASLAMVLSYVESLFPAFVAVPGVKLGLANIAVVFALYSLGFWEAGVVSLVRAVTLALLFGNGASLLYSLAGACLSLAGMAALKKTGLFAPVSVSVAGGVLHNLGQIAMACLLLETNVIFYYLPYLILSGTLAGIAIGLLAGYLVRRIPIDP